ncbi:MAG: IS110 family transposase [Parafannyhessea umbonata]|jgi:transposase|nr:IS110 family transposase [Parafannyhessea umbonata]
MARNNAGEPPAAGPVIAGVDTHKDAHVLCLLDSLGRRLSSASFPADADGYDALARAIGDPGDCMVVGVEGTASYGAGLARRLAELGYNVVEVLRPKRDRLMVGADKNDPEDAERAARKAASGDGCSVPKAQDGWVEALRQDYVARRQLVKTTTACVDCAKSLLTTAPEPVRERFRHESDAAGLMEALACAEPAGTAVEAAALGSLRSLALAWREARRQAEGCESRMRSLIEANAPALLGVECVGTISAAALAVTAGDNPDRMGGEASFAAVCGVSPVEASSGKVKRHRLNRGGNRQANWALWQIVKARMASDERTKAYVERRTREGKSKREIMRCLKRYVAREVYKVLLDPNPDGAPPHGDGLRRMRRARRVTQREVAEALGVSVTTIANLEHGRARSTRLESGYYAFLTS